MSAARPAAVRFADRADAGRLLAEELAARRLRQPVIFALPRGGVPVARPVADRLGAPLDLLLVRKIGAPGEPELAVASVIDCGGPDLLPSDIAFNEAIMAELGLSRDDVAAVARLERGEMARRRALYLAGREPVETAARDAVIVDDGVATGASILAAVNALRSRSPARIIVAVPVAPGEAVTRLKEVADEVVCLSQPMPFIAVGAHYRSFPQVTDQQVVAALHGDGDARCSPDVRDGQAPPRG